MRGRGTEREGGREGEEERGGEGRRNGRRGDEEQRERKGEEERGRERRERRREGERGRGRGGGEGGDSHAMYLATLYMPAHPKYASNTTTLGDTPCHNYTYDAIFFVHVRSTLLINTCYLHGWVWLPRDQLLSAVLLTENT